MVVVGVQLFVPGLYLPPVLVAGDPPHTIISLPVQTAVCWARAEGTLVVPVAVQLSVLGLYLPPLFKFIVSPDPPQTTIALPVQIVV